MRKAQRLDEIDMIVRDLLASPDRADELKRKLRDRLNPRGSMPRRKTHLRVVSSHNSDPDSLWDNVPV